MSAEANYFKLGLFVIGAAVLMLVGVLFFGGRALTQEIVYMETYLDESVEGLEVGSPVTYRGVRIGRVDRIGFVADEYGIKPGTKDFKDYGGHVMVVMAIDVSDEDERRTARLLTELEKEGLRIRLKSHALTGVAYLEADYMEPEYLEAEEPEKIIWTPRNPYLRSAPSMLSTFALTAENAFRKIGDIEELVSKTDKLLKGTDELVTTLKKAVTDAKVGEVSRDLKLLLATVKDAVEKAKVDEVAGDLKKLIASADAAVKNARVGEISHATIALLTTATVAIKDAKTAQVSVDVRALLTEVRQTNAHLQTLLKTPKGAAPVTLAKTIADLDKVIVRIDQILKRQGPAISRATTNIATVAEQLRKLVDDLERNPARLLFGGPPERSRKVNP